MNPTTHEESVTTALPTSPFSVVWSGGHSYVFERPGVLGRFRWVGLDDRGRPIELSAADLHARGWTLQPG